MRRTLTVVVALLFVVMALALAAAGEAAHASPPQAPLATDPQLARTAAHAPVGVPSYDNEGTVLVSHGTDQAFILTRIKVTYSDLGLPITNQGHGVGVRVSGVQRISLRVALHTRGGTVASDLSGAETNSGQLPGNPAVFRATSPVLATGGLVPNPNYCESWTTVAYGVRWGNGDLTRGTLTAPSDLFNDNCFLN